MFDASALKLSSCERRMFYEVVIGYRESLINNMMQFGIATHKFREHWRGTGNFGEAIKKAVNHYSNTPMNVVPEKDYLTPEFLKELCLKYYLKYQKDDWTTVKYKDQPLLEIGFAFPFLETLSCEVLIAGTIDDIMQKNSDIAVVDLKTTGAWKVQYYLNGYRMSPQLRLYLWALREYKELYPDIFPENIDPYNLCAFIEGAFYAGANTENIQFIRSESFFYKDIPEFKKQVEAVVKITCDNTDKYLQDGTLPPKNGILNNSCSGCKYFNACAQPDEIAAKDFLDKHFITKVYNPLKFNDP